MASENCLRLKSILLAIDKSISVAESLTGGNLQASISSVSGSSDYFEGGVTAYNIEQKVSLLGVVREHAASVNCVSQRVAEQMASGVRELFGSFVGVSTTGYAERWPSGGITEPFAFYAIDIGDWVNSGRIEGGDRGRVDVQQFVTETVMERLVESFREIERLSPAPNSLDDVQQQLQTANLW